MIDRRTFLAAMAMSAGIAPLERRSPYESTHEPTSEVHVDVAAIDRARVLAAARRYLGERPVTITSASSPRSAGGRHDFSSEGAYRWPDPANPHGPQLQ